MYRAWNMNVPQASVEQSEEEIFSGIVLKFWKNPHIYDFAVKLKSRSFKKRKLNSPICDKLCAALRLMCSESYVQQEEKLKLNTERKNSSNDRNLEIMKSQEIK
jgi:hypothetical protein